MKFKVEKTDLRAITRNPRAHTQIYIARRDAEGRRDRKLWLEFGELSRIWRREDDGRVLLGTYLGFGATDFEHNSAYVLRLPVIGMQFADLRYHMTIFNAWVDPDGQDEFRVPSPGYNPLTHPKAMRCDPCPYNDPPHTIVPEGLYGGAPFNPELFRAVAGCPIQIHIGVRRDEEEDQRCPNSV